MTKRTGNAEATQAGNGASGPLAAALTPWLAAMTATRTHPLEWVHALGIEALSDVFRAEAEALAGRKGTHRAERTHHHWGHTAQQAPEHRLRAERILRAALELPPRGLGPALLRE